MINGEVETATTRVRGGYDVIVSSSSANPVGVEQLSGIDGVLRVAPLARTSGLFRSGDMKEDVLWNVTAFDGRFVRGGAPELEDRGSTSDAAAWEAVLHDPSLAIVDPVFLQEGAGGVRRRAGHQDQGQGSVHGPRAGPHGRGARGERLLHRERRLHGAAGREQVLRLPAR